MAPLIDREAEFQALNAMSGVLLRTREAKALTPQGQARADGRPLDPACVDRLVKLVEFMQVRAPFAAPDADISPDRKRAGAFMEAYFSNFIAPSDYWAAIKGENGPSLIR